MALIIETSNAYGRNLLQGVVAYIREHAPWSFYLAEQGRGDDPPAWLARWQGDGIIARIERPRIGESSPGQEIAGGGFECRKVRAQRTVGRDR